MSPAELGALEIKKHRRYLERAGWRTELRVYDIPLEETPPITRPGDYFPGESDGARVDPGGVSVGSEGISRALGMIGAVLPRGELTMMRMTIVGSTPILDASTDTATFDYEF